MQQAIRFCDHCGAANLDHATHCFACQTSLPQPVPYTQAPSGNGTVAPVSATTLTFTGSQEFETPHPLPADFLLVQRFRIIEQIGAGGFGVVYKAWDTEQSQKCVAVKQISLDHLSAREMIQVTDSYNREITYHTLIWHKNVPTVFAYFTDPRHWYLVMEYIEGETLEDYLKHVPGGKLPLREVLSIGIQLCNVLGYLHEEFKIIFRDVKPANIMRTQHGHLYLIDFGIARRYVRGKTRDTTPLGSPGYAAPEQYGTAQSTTKTDIYGLGATLLTLLTGIDPSQESPDDSSSSSQSPHIPANLQTLLDQMLATDPDQRPAHMGIVKRRLIFIRMSF